PSLPPLPAPPPLPPPAPRPAPPRQYHVPGRAPGDRRGARHDFITPRNADPPRNRPPVERRVPRRERRRQRGTRDRRRRQPAVVLALRPVQLHQDRQLRVRRREETRERRRVRTRLVAAALRPARRARLPRDPELAQRRLPARSLLHHLHQRRRDLLRHLRRHHAPHRLRLGLP